MSKEIEVPDLKEIKNLPAKIWIQIDDDDFETEDFKDLDNEYVTWCDAKINTRDEKYLRAKSIEAAFEIMLLNEQCGGTGWWSGWHALKEAMGVKQS